jgi:translation initiation factor IF-2
VADIAILVIAADDSVQPQTKEAMGIIKKAGLPMLVAINKVDKPDANVDKVKTDLSEAGIQPEDWGGKTIMVPVSAKEGTGIEDLLDMVLLTADLEKNRIQADPGRQAIGTIIESHVDPGEGAVATVLVQAGTLHDGDVLTVGDTWGKVKMLKDWTGKRVQAAPPAFPVQILGLKGSPQVGDILEVVEDTKEFRRARKKVVARRPAVAQDVAASIPQEEEGEEEALTIKELNIVLKADTLGSLEAIEAQIGKLHHEDLKITIVSKGLGNITEADVLRTETSDALLMGFSVHPLAATEDVARGKHVEIHTYSIIYDLVNDVIAAGEALLEPEVTQELHGELQVLAVFLTKRKSMIFGGKVTKGKIVDKSDVIILREGQPVGEGKLIELESNKVKAKEVAQGSECGMKYEGPPIVQVGDTVRSLTRKTVQKKIQVR